MNNVIFEDLGLIDYKKGWEHQEAIFTKALNLKQINSNSTPINHLIFCEHPHVFTLGRSGTKDNLLITDELLKKIDAVFYKIDRGGDITYHGPGQIVGYPIFDLETLKIGIKEYIHLLEDAIILTLSEFNIKSSRLDGATGVWLDTDQPQKTRKICAIGVKASRYVSMHGFALNVNTNLDYFRYINPCGFIDKGVTSVEKELGKMIDVELVKEKLLKNIISIFSFQKDI